VLVALQARSITSLNASAFMSDWTFQAGIRRLKADHDALKRALAEAGQVGVVGRLAALHEPQPLTVNGTTSRGEGSASFAAIRGCQTDQGS